ncbi:putative peroxygenase 4 [Iris pallida]|uniref:Peroxygenase 4 n=1 Tax=Iris pallida TaxID=29817 RepID=A0AAX6EV10_IRIPA|nr:putative peroxygenase 4 [Iris pallida]
MSSNISEGGGGEEKMDGGGSGGGEIMTALQKHVAFFDRNKDGIIYPSETYQGFRAIGCGIPLSAFAAAFINGFLGPKTKPGKYPSLRFPIYVKNISKGKHGSDSDAYDSEGRFVPAKFEDIFSKHAHTHPNALTSEELSTMLKENRDPKNYAGWVASWIEWKILYSLCKDKNGLLQKDTVRGAYDGSLFLQMEKERASPQKKV